MEPKELNKILHDSEKSVSQKWNGKDRLWSRIEEAETQVDQLNPFGRILKPAIAVLTITLLVISVVYFSKTGVKPQDNPPQITDTETNTEAFTFDAYVVLMGWPSTENDSEDIESEEFYEEIDYFDLLGG